MILPAFSFGISAGKLGYDLLFELHHFKCKLS